MPGHEEVQPEPPGGSKRIWVEFAAAAAMDKWITRSSLMRSALNVIPSVHFGAWVGWEDYKDEGEVVMYFRASDVRSWLLQVLG